MVSPFIYGKGRKQTESLRFVPKVSRGGWRDTGLIKKL